MLSWTREAYETIPRRVMPKKQPPIVDDADVDFFIDTMLKKATTSLTQEELADLVSGFASDHAKLTGMSDEWGHELARRVRQRALWTKPDKSA
jgi:hypothetical protein